MNMAEVIQRKKDRCEFAEKLKSEGYTLKQIAEKMGRSTTQVSQYLKYAKYLKLNKKDWDYGLSVRAKNILETHGITSKEKALEFYNLCAKPHRFRNFGIKTYNELGEWLGFPDLQSERTEIQIARAKEILLKPIVNKLVEFSKAIAGEDAKLVIGRAYQSFQK